MLNKRQTQHIHILMMSERVKLSNLVVWRAESAIHFGRILRGYICLIAPLHLLVNQLHESTAAFIKLANPNIVRGSIFIRM